METAVFGAGSFWGVEARFNELSGVLETAAGYEGGSLEHPTYKEVCAGGTEHAEVVQVRFDAGRLSYEALLDAFFAMHDPTQKNRQGPDWGSQYRSVVFVENAAQEAAAREKIAELQAAGVFRGAIVTEIRAAGRFWRAEEFHQRYLEKRGMVGCAI